MKKLEQRNNKILGFGEVMLRLSPPNHQKIIQSNSFDAVYSGGEANVIISLSIFGHNTKFVTKLPDNHLGKTAINKLRGYNIDIDDVVLGDGRLGIYFSEIGHGLRSTEVIYDRKYSAISMAKKEEFKIEEMLEGVGLVHLSGITPALSSELYDFMIDFMKKCKEKNVIVSYDSNFRNKLWTVEEARGFMEEVLPYVDIAFLGHLDIIRILNFEDKKLEFEDNLKDLYTRLFEKYSNLKYAACTKRTVNTINNNDLQGYLFDGKELIKSNKFNFDILDRVGGGDAFTAGVLHGILRKMENERIIEFATCASVLKHSIQGDINLVDEDTVNSLIDNGLKNIKR